MRVLGMAAVLITLSATGCSSSTPPIGPSPVADTPGSGTSGLSSIAGSWVGSAFDSTGSAMGAGMASSMMTNMTWNITQTGNAFTGTMQFSGYTGGQMTVSGTINGTTATFTMTMPSGSMVTTMCSAIANGTFDVDSRMTQMRGTYSGTNSCSGAFGGGQVTMTRR